MKAIEMKHEFYWLEKAAINATAHMSRTAHPQGHASSTA
jgi:hypothetical protein